MQKQDIVIIGAGVIGLSIAPEVSVLSRKTLVLEQHNAFGRETSSRNSEVIHAGIYYKKDSLKARTCVEGRALLYKLAKSEHIPHKRTGKLIVATNEKEEETLHNLFKNGRENGVEHLSIIEPDQINRLEPNIKARLALYSPDTGIIDSHAFMKYLEQASKSNGADIVYNVKVTGLEKKRDSYEVTVIDADHDILKFETNVVINCAGLQSDKIAEYIGINVRENKYVLNYCKGDYFRVSPKKSAKIKGLVYPVPKHHSEGLGIHATPDLSGSLRLGPDHEYIKREKANYDVNPGKLTSFLNAVKPFLPFLKEEDLTADTSGIRPRLFKENEPERDYIIKEESDKGFPGFINLIGIESPGLTSALEIAKIVKSKVQNIISLSPKGRRN